MLISIGILAWNEELEIERTLRSLFQQTALQVSPPELAGCSWEIIVVPNGCKDDTAGVSRRVLADCVATGNRRDVSWRVCEVAESGKSNAWNRFVHELSAPGAEMIVLMDADIEFGEPTTLSNTVMALAANPRAVAAVDVPLKDAVKKPRKSALELLSLRATGDVTQRAPELCGQFFAARAEALRRI